MSSAAGGRVELSPDTAPDTVFKRRLSEGILSYQQCTQCPDVIFPPRVLCPACGSPNPAWKESDGKGVVYSTTTVHRRGEDPWDVSLVALDEGFRMMSSVRGIPPEDVVIGMRVELKIELADELVPVFVKAAR